MDQHGTDNIVRVNTSIIVLSRAVPGQHAFKNRASRYGTFSSRSCERASVLNRCKTVLSMRICFTLTRPRGLTCTSHDKCSTGNTARIELPLRTRSFAVVQGHVLSREEILLAPDMASSSTWSREKTCRLIEIWGEIWGDGWIQAQLHGSYRNQDVYTKIARELNDSGYERTFQQCRDKLKKLGDYKKAKDHQGKMGEGRKDWDFFEFMNDILGNRPATQPSVIIDTLAEDDQALEQSSSCI